MKPEFTDPTRALVRLPHQFEPLRLQGDILRLSQAEWSSHPERIPGVSILPLVSVGGGRNADLAISGPMRETSALMRSPWLRQVLAAFEAPVSGTQLLRIGPNATLPPRRRSGYNWYRRIRIHVPVLTNPAVTFECGPASAHLHAGESLGVDLWRKHSLTNRPDSPCIHLVVDLKVSAEALRTGEQLVPYIE